MIESHHHKYKIMHNCVLATLGHSIGNIISHKWSPQPLLVIATCVIGDLFVFWAWKDSAFSVGTIWSHMGQNGHSWIKLTQMGVGWVKWLPPFFIWSFVCWPLCSLLYGWLSVCLSCSLLLTAHLDLFHMRKYAKQFQLLLFFLSLCFGSIMVHFWWPLKKMISHISFCLIHFTCKESNIFQTCFQTLHAPCQTLIKHLSLTIRHYCWRNNIG